MRVLQVAMPTWSHKSVGCYNIRACYLHPRLHHQPHHHITIAAASSSETQHHLLLPSNRYMGIMENKMETTGIIGIILGLCRDYREILGLSRDHGKEDGNHYSLFRI